MGIFRKLFRAENTAAPPPKEAAATEVKAAPNPVEADEPIAPEQDRSVARPSAQLHEISRPDPRPNRVKSRLMSYGQLDAVLDELEGSGTTTKGAIARPVGWLVVIEGPGTGGWFTLDHGVSQIGRGPDQNIQLNFGDTTISRSAHASIAYEQADHRFRIGPGECQNGVLVNGQVVNGPTNVCHGDRITIGETTLRLAAFCDDRFSWAPIIDKGDRNALSA